MGVPRSLITNDFARNTGKYADRHLLASHLPRPTEMPSFRGSHSPDTCVPRNQWSVRCFRNGYRHTQDHYHRIWGNRRSFVGHGTFVGKLVVQCDLAFAAANRVEINEDRGGRHFHSIVSSSVTRCSWKNCRHIVETSCSFSKLVLLSVC